MATDRARINTLEIEVRRLIQRQMPRQIGEVADSAASGVTDHGALTGLADDDHPQYHNDARGDARYDPLGAAAAAAAASQPLDLDLTAIAALATTAFGRALLTLADAAEFTATANVATPVLKGLAPASGGGTANFLRADLTWAAPPGGGGGGNLDDILALEALL